MAGISNTPHAVLRCGRFMLDLSKPRIMAVINMTPDSFSGDGLQGRLDAALARAEAALEAGADVLDIGGESSRPGAAPVTEQEELDRVLPLVERLAAWPVPVSVDTVKPAVMRAVIRAGASMINDINGFRAPEAVEVTSAADVALCVMHMQGVPGTMQAAPRYDDVVTEVASFLAERAGVLQAQGVAADRLCVDPGFGFGKTVADNLALLRAIPQLLMLGFPVLAGLSRKSMIGHITGRPVEQRVVGSVTAALLAVEQGARIVRVHDVPETVDAFKLRQALHGDVALA